MCIKIHKTHDTFSPSAPLTVNPFSEGKTSKVSAGVLGP